MGVSSSSVLDNVACKNRLRGLILAITLSAACHSCAHSGERAMFSEHAVPRQKIDIPVEPKAALFVEQSRQRLSLTAEYNSLRHCNTLSSPKVFAIGSSTMASLLGPAIKRMLKRSRPKAKFAQWGKPSSGLARPDFHDWPAQVPRIIRRHRPDMFVVSLGTNDYQALRKRNGSWVRPHTARWKRLYAQRVRKMLELMSGEGRTRLVVWVGPTSFRGEGPRVLGPLISRIVRQEIERFGGPAVFVDAFAATSDNRNNPLETYRIPGKRRPQPMRSHDGIHLKIGAVRALMAAPAVHHLLKCIAEDKP